MKSEKSRLLSTSQPLTLDQWTADWFTVRQFRLTTSSSKSSLLQVEDMFCWDYGCRLLGAQNLKVMLTCFWSPRHLLVLTKRSTEGMMRGTINEPFIFHALKQLEWVHSVYNSGMICHKSA